MFDSSALQKYKRLFRGATELRLQRNRSFSYNYYDGKVSVESLTEPMDVSGVCARVSLLTGSGELCGFAALPRMGEDDIRRVLKAAQSNLELLSCKPHDLPSGAANSFLPLERPFYYIGPDEVRTIFNECASYIAVNYPEFILESGNLLDRTSEKLLAATSGTDSHCLEEYGAIRLNLCKRGAEDREIEDTFYPLDYFDRLLSDPSPLFRHIDRMVRGYDTRREQAELPMVELEGGVYDCVLSPSFVGMLAHEAVGHTMESDSVKQRGSAGSRNFGQQVASPLVSLTDFARSAYGKRLPIRLVTDDEGTPAVDAEIIKDGVLCGMMNTRSDARLLNCPPTGSARAALYSDEPIVRMRNTCFLPGTSSFEELIASIDHGCYLKTSGGGNGDVTGMFSMVIAEAYEVRNGKFSARLVPTVAAGSAWDALKSVSMVSTNFTVDPEVSSCGKKQSIFVSSGGPEMKLKLYLGGK